MSSVFDITNFQHTLKCTGCFTGHVLYVCIGESDQPESANGFGGPRTHASLAACATATAPPTATFTPTKLWK